MDNLEEKDNENINEKEANIANKEPNNNKKHKKENNFKVEILGEQYKEYDLSFKLIVIGNASVGKSCLSLKAIKGVFEENYFNTVGFEFSSLHIKLNNQIIKLQIWDTCGQETYRSLVVNFFRNSSLAILVYAINDQKSFDDLGEWLKQLRTYSSPDCKIFLIGNKADLEDKRQIPYEKGKHYQENNKLDFFMETSAKTGLNAQELFITAAKLLYSSFLKYKEKDLSIKNEKKVLNSISKTFELNNTGEDYSNNSEGCC